MHIIELTFCHSDSPFILQFSFPLWRHWCWILIRERFQAFNNRVPCTIGLWKSERPILPVFPPICSLLYFDVQRTSMWFQSSQAVDWNGSTTTAKGRTTDHPRKYGRCVCGIRTRGTCTIEFCKPGVCVSTTAQRLLEREREKERERGDCFCHVNFWDLSQCS